MIAVIRGGPIVLAPEAKPTPVELPPVFELLHAATVVPFFDAMADDSSQEDTLVCRQHPPQQGHPYWSCFEPYSVMQSCHL